MEGIIDVKAIRTGFGEFLDEQEETKLQVFWEDEVMREAVRKVLLYSLYNQGTLKKGKTAFQPDRNFMLSFANRKDMSHEDKGRFLDAIIAGISVLAEGFDMLSAYKRIPEIKGQESNPAL